MASPQDTDPAAEGDWFDDTPDPPPAASGRRLTLADDPDHGDPRSDDTAQPWDDADDGRDDWFAPTPAPAGDEWDTPSGTPDDVDRTAYSAVQGGAEFDARSQLLRGTASDTTTTITGSGAVSAPQRSWWRRHRSAVAVSSAIAVLLAGVAAAGLWVTGATDDTDATTGYAESAQTADDALAESAGSAPPAAVGGAAAADFTWCENLGAGVPVTDATTDPGGAAIWRFEKAMYYDRDPVAARAVGTPEAVMASADRLRLGIDQMEPNLEFCVLADPVSAGVYDVSIFERGPGIDPRTSKQRFTTTDQGGTAAITAVTIR